MAKRVTPVNPTFVLAERMLARLSDDLLNRHMSSKDKEREERLAAALRENLRRRKAQARELDSKPDESANGD
jgi:hypothetical protein